MTPARTVLRSAAAALALLSTFPIFPASAATTKQHYQKQAELTCGAGIGCLAVLPKLPANQALDIDHVVCDLNTAGQVVFAGLILMPASLSFTMPLDLLWQRTAGGSHYYTLGGELNVRVPLGRQAEVGVLASSTPYGSCSFTGTLLITT